MYGGLARIYDELIAEDIDYTLWTNIIFELCKKYEIKMQNYLDVACGTGNISVILASKFRNTYCVDLSQDMLMEAQEKFLESRVKANFVCQDMTCLNLNRKFELITCCLDGTNYLLDDESIYNYFKSIYNHLESGGIFILDINSEYKLKELLGNKVFTYNNDEIVYIWENSCDNKTINMDITFFVKNDDGTYERIDEEHEERILEEKFIENIMIECGFEIVDKLDNYCLDKKVTKDTQRITYVIRKLKNI
jgi:ubiquinone/menaquinone biosynthesis C-methylase UbiE